jgi:hypothetical protein
MHMSNILVGNGKPGKPAIHGSVLTALPRAEKLVWLVAITAGEVNLLSLNLAQLPQAFGVSPTNLREARRAAGQIIRSRPRKPAAPALAPSPVSSPIVDVIETFRKIGPDGFLQLAEMMERDGLARAAATAKVNGNGAALDGGAPHCVI